MRNSIMTRMLIILAAGLSVLSGAALAAGGKAKAPKHVHWHFAGAFGTYDKEALQRGFQVYETVCASCHGLKLLSFRNLGQKGGPFYLENCPAGVPSNVDCSNPNDNPVVKAIASNYRFKVVDGPDDTGDMFERAPVPSDRFPSPYANNQIARLANNNALPPDLSADRKGASSRRRLFLQPPCRL